MTPPTGKRTATRAVSALLAVAVLMGPACATGATDPGTTPTTDVAPDPTAPRTPPDHPACKIVIDLPSGDGDCVDAPEWTSAAEVRLTVPTGWARVQGDVAGGRWISPDGDISVHVRAHDARNVTTVQEYAAAIAAELGAGKVAEVLDASTSGGNPAALLRLNDDSGGSLLFLTLVDAGSALHVGFTAADTRLLTQPGPIDLVLGSLAVTARDELGA